MKYVAIPNIFHISFNKDISHRCNFNCPYCIAAKEKDESRIVDTSDAKRILSEFPSDITLTGTGEPLVEYDKIIDILEFIKSNNLNSKVKIITNGYFVDKIKYLLTTYPNVHFVRTLTMSNTDKAHNNKNVIFNDRIVNKLLVDVNEDFSSYIPQLRSDKNFILRTMSRSNVTKEFKGSVMEKLLKDNQDILHKILPTSLVKYGFGIACVGNILNFEIQCMPINYLQFHDKNNLLKGIMEYKDAMYSYMQKNIQKCCCLNDNDNLEEDCFKIMDDYQEAIKDSEITEKLYEEIYAEKYDESLPTIDVSIELYNNEQFYSLDPLLGNYSKIFKAPVNRAKDLLDVMNHDYCYIVFPFRNNYIIMSGKSINILKLFSEPDKYKLHGKIFTQMFRTFIKSIRI